MNKEEFKGKFLDTLIQDSEVNQYFDGASEERQEQLRAHLEKYVDTSYDSVAQEYYETKGIGSYAAKTLRGLGGIVGGLGTYLFFTVPGAGFGAKLIGVGAKSLADLIDNHHYEKFKDGDAWVTKEGMGIATETVVTRLLSYLPLFGLEEAADLWSGLSKYDRRIAAHTLSRAKDGFLKYMKQEEEHSVIPLTRFKNPAYDKSSIDSIAA